MISLATFVPSVVGFQNVNGKSESKEAGRAEKEWTVLVYMAADNNLEDVAIADFNEMEMVGSGPDLNIVVQFDRISGHDSSNGDWTDTRRYLVEQDFDPVVINSVPVNDSMGELNMGNPGTLKDFLEWGVDNYPAKRYILVMWDHGSGLFRRRGDSGNEETRGFCKDWSSGSDDLKMWELSSVLSELKESHGTEYEIIAADVCYFGYLESAYQVKKYTKFFIGASDEEPAAGWDYQRALSFISEKPLSTSRDMAINIVERFLEDYEQGYITQMALSIASMEKFLIPALETFTRALISSTYHYHSEIQIARRHSDTPRSRYVDLYSFVKLIKDDITLPLSLKQKATELSIALKDSIVAYGTGSDHPNSLGLAIWFPENILSTSNYNTYLRKFDFSETSWIDFLKEYDSPTPISIDHVPLGDTENVNGPYIFDATVHAPTGSIAKVVLNYSVDEKNFIPVEFLRLEDIYRAILDITVNDATLYYYIELFLSDNSTYTEPVNAEPSIPGTLYSFWVGLDLTAPRIIHFPVVYITETENSYTMIATITDNMGIDINSTFLNYMVNSSAPGTPVTKILLEQVTNTIFQGDIPPFPCYTKVYYWFETKDISMAGNSARDPVDDYYLSTFVQSKKKLLIDLAHGNDKDYTTITEEFLAENFELETLNKRANEEELDGYDIYVTTGPTETFTTTELSALEDFLLKGASVFVLGGGENDITLPITSMGGISWTDSNAPGKGNTSHINRSLEKFDYVETIYYDRHNRVLEGGNHTILKSENDENLSVYSNIGKGRLAVISDGILSDGNISKEGEYSPYDNFEFARSLLHLLLDNRKPVPVINIVETPELPNIIKINTPYTFSGLGSYDLDGPIANYTWEINGKNIGYDKLITHTFTESGNYDLNLHVKDFEDTWSHASVRYVANLPPEPRMEATLNLSGPLEIIDSGVNVPGGESIHFKSLSVDIDGIIANERWDFGDGSKPVENESTVVHAYDKKGKFLVTLSVWDNLMIERSTTALFNISNAPPVVVIEVQRSGKEDDTIYMSAIKSHDPNDPSDVFYKNVRWDFGDGTGKDHSLSANHIYRKAGIYNITLYITDLDLEDPLTAFAVEQIRIDNRPPVANATDIHTNGATITFSAINSTDTPSDYDTLQYHWNFGDGSVGSGVTVVHHFKEDGNYTVILTVTDDDGANDTRILYVTISSTSKMRINYYAVAAFVFLLILLIVIWVNPSFIRQKVNGTESPAKTEPIKKIAKKKKIVIKKVARENGKGKEIEAGEKDENTENTENADVVEMSDDIMQGIPLDQ
jgi:PKD repeat protein